MPNVPLVNPYDEPLPSSNGEVLRLVATTSTFGALLCGAAAGTASAAPLDQFDLDLSGVNAPEFGSISIPAPDLSTTRFQLSTPPIVDLPTVTVPKIELGDPPSALTPVIPAVTPPVTTPTPDAVTAPTAPAATTPTPGPVTTPDAAATPVVVTTPLDSTAPPAPSFPAPGDAAAGGGQGAPVLGDVTIPPPDPTTDQFQLSVDQAPVPTALPPVELPTPAPGTTGASPVDTVTLGEPTEDGGTGTATVTTPDATPVPTDPSYTGVVTDVSDPLVPVAPEGAPGEVLVAQTPTPTPTPTPGNPLVPSVDSVREDAEVIGDLLRQGGQYALDQAQQAVGSFNAGEALEQLEEVGVSFLPGEGYKIGSYEWQGYDVNENSLRLGERAAGIENTIQDKRAENVRIFGTVNEATLQQNADNQQVGQETTRLINEAGNAQQDLNATTGDNNSAARDNAATQNTAENVRAGQQADVDRNNRAVTDEIAQRNYERLVSSATTPEQLRLVEEIQGRLAKGDLLVDIMPGVDPAQLEAPPLETGVAAQQTAAAFDPQQAQRNREQRIAAGEPTRLVDPAVTLNPTASTEELAKEYQQSLQALEGRPRAEPITLPEFQDLGEVPPNPELLTQAEIEAKRDARNATITESQTFSFVPGVGTLSSPSEAQNLRVYGETIMDSVGTEEGQRNQVGRALELQREQLDNTNNNILLSNAETAGLQDRLQSNVDAATSATNTAQDFTVDQAAVSSAAGQQRFEDGQPRADERAEVALDNADAFSTANITFADQEFERSLGQPEAERLIQQLAIQGQNLSPDEQAFLYENLRGQSTSRPQDVIEGLRSDLDTRTEEEKAQGVPHPFEFILKSGDPQSAPSTTVPSTTVPSTQQPSDFGTPPADDPEVQQFLRDNPDIAPAQ